MWLAKKIKAGALQYVLVVSVLIALIVFAFISLLYLQQKLQVKKVLYKEAVENVESGFNYLGTSTIPYNSEQTIQLSENPLEKTSVIKQHWGVFDLVTITSKVKNEVFIKSALLGENNKEQKALYLQENNRPLVVVGNTKIIGNVSLPKQGIKSGNIAGNSYNGNSLFYGVKKGNSSGKMPKINNIESFKKAFVQERVPNDSIEYFMVEDTQQRIQKFDKPIAVSESLSPIILKNIILQGKIRIQSETSIRVEASATLHDVILIAPKVTIASEVKGNFQVFASDKIEVAKRCELQYPSALVLITKNNATIEETITINENSTVKGSVVFIAERNKEISNFNHQVSISKNTTVVGEVYCTENLELLGSVFGAVYTNNFITKQYGSVYVNHIYNGIINRKKLPNEYCGLFIEDKRKKVAKWLY